MLATKPRVEAVYQLPSNWLALTVLSVTGELILLVRYTTTKSSAGSIMVRVPVQPWWPMVPREACTPKYQGRPQSPCRHQPCPQVAEESLRETKYSFTLAPKSRWVP